MSEFQERIREQLKSSRNGDRDLSEITNRLQNQVNELVERVTGVRQVKRRYFMGGLTIGVLVGIMVGTFIGMLIHSVTDHKG